VLYRYRELYWVCVSNKHLEKRKKSGRHWWRNYKVYVCCKINWLLDCCVAHLKDLSKIFWN